MARCKHNLGLTCQWLAIHRACQALGLAVRRACSKHGRPQLLKPLNRERILQARRGTLSWNTSLAGIDRGALTMLAVLVLAVLLFGGSSRYDVMQNALMQPLAWLVAGFALVLAAREQLRQLKWPLVFLLALCLITVLQLLPLPYGMWTGLPGREPLADIATAIGNDSARPLSMVPSRTFNAAAALGIPLAAFFVIAAIGRRAVIPVLVAIVALAAANSALAFLQFASGFAEATYPYAVTNLGEPVGIFANRNHSAVFNALALLVIAFLATRAERRQFAGADVLLWATYGLIFLTIPMNGSRAGLLCTGIATAATAWLVYRAGKVAQAAPGAKSQHGLARMLPAAVILIFAVGMLGLFMFSDRLVAFERTVESNPLEDLRFKILPILGDMITGYFPLGIGFGAFEDVYRIHETGDLLRPNYLNMAHNDWLQWLIEAGLPGIVLLLGFLGWLAWHLRRLKKLDEGFFVLGLAGAAIIAIASYFDYPLRTPIFQVAGVWFVCALALKGTTRRAESDGMTGNFD